MCLILLSYKYHPQYRLVLAANRDEFYDRPTAPLGFWEDNPDVLAGRDLKSMGTWMGVTRSGKIAAVTNYREPASQVPNATSRGHLVSNFLVGREPPAQYLEAIQIKTRQYSGFNLLVGDTRELRYFSNRGGEPARLNEGIYGLSNRFLDSGWPKVRRGKSLLKSELKEHNPLNSSRLLKLLQNQDKAPDEQLPETGVGIEWERVLCPIFITSRNYGTRCSTLLTIDHANHVRVTELTWKPSQSTPTLQEKREFDFSINA